MNQIMQLVLDNKAAPRAFTVTAQAGLTRIDLYDVIGDDYGVSASAFASALNGITGGEVALHINSPGGDVFAARAMVAAISAHPANITAYVDGLAASAASYVATACDKVVMQQGAMMMIHQASTIVWGNSGAMRDTADLLDKIDNTIVADYARKTGQDDAQIFAWMAAETWFEASEAVANGFADEVIENPKGKAKNTWNLAAYANVPQALKEPEPPQEEPHHEPAEIAGFFMSAANANRLRLAAI